MKKEYLEAVNAEAGDLLVNQAITVEEYATWQKMLGIMANRLYYKGEQPDTFGRVEWCDDDIRAAIEDNAEEDEDVEISEELVAAVRQRCESHHFTDQMIEAGWETLREIIDIVVSERKAV